MTTVAVPPVSARADVMTASGADRTVAMARLCACSWLRRCWVSMNRPPSTSATTQAPPADPAGIRGGLPGEGRRPGPEAGGPAAGGGGRLRGPGRLVENRLRTGWGGRHGRDGREPPRRLPQAPGLLTA